MALVLRHKFNLYFYPLTCGSITEKCKDRAAGKVQQISIIAVTLALQPVAAYLASCQGRVWCTCQMEKPWAFPEYVPGLFKAPEQRPRDASGR